MASFVFFLMAFSVLFPHKVVGGIAVGVDDLLAAILIVWLPAVFIRSASTRWSPPVLIAGVLWVAIIVHGVILGLVAGLDILGYVDPPTEMWQYAKRMTFFYAAFAMASQGPEATRPAYKILFIATILAGLIGLAQIPQGFISEAIASLYARTDFQLENLIDKDLGVRRTYGVAGHPVAWGGFCVFMATLAIPWLIDGSRDRQRGYAMWRFAAMILSAVALVNLLFSASRAAIVALAVVLVLSGVVELSIRRGGLSGGLRWASLVIVLPVGALLLGIDRIGFLVFRFVILGETAGGGRVDQVLSGTQLLDWHGAWLSGVGNAVQRMYSVSFGVEVEPVYLVVNYGVFGAAMRYGLLAVLAYMSLRLIRLGDAPVSALGMTGLLLIAGYLVFSLGYFFFQELFVGVTPWLVLGLIAGTYQFQWATTRSNSSAVHRTGGGDRSEVPAL